LEQLICSAAFKQASFLDAQSFVVEYQQGWPHKKSLLECLVGTHERDREKGHTQYGIHRDDIKIYAKNRLAREILSRGQKKLMTLQLRFAQAGVLFAQHERLKSIFLLDDLSAELDSVHQAKVMQALIEVNYQAIITSTQRQHQWELAIGEQCRDFKMFHVEHGSVLTLEADMELI
jgi:DNA replication and repair protein RecF